MLTAKQKADKLREAIALLQDVDCLQQVVMADLDSDVCYELHNEIEDIIYTLEEAVEELLEGEDA
jgi:energy-converting hydrogenase A subunit M